MKKRSEIALRTTAPAQDERRLLGELDRALEALKQTTGLKGRVLARQAETEIDERAGALVEIGTNGQRHRYLVDAQTRVDRFTTLGHLKARLDPFGERNETQRRRGNDTERALTSDDRADEIVAGRRPTRGRAQLHELSIRQNQIEREYVVGRRSVLERVGAARILGDIAPDRAHELTRRVRRVVEAERRNAPGDLRVHDARLDVHDAIERVDPEDSIHPRALDHHRVSGERTTGQACPRTPRHEWHIE